ncbi:TPA: conjugal transfer protein TraD [Legionella pneumophila]|nr:conjugal transfer protein TraD [Legionella pneumophila]
MAMLKQIEKEKQIIARCENSLSLEKIKKRRQDTRRKIELGGLIIKSGISDQNKSVILGGLVYIFEKIKKDQNFLSSLELIGEDLFNSKSTLK